MVLEYSKEERFPIISDAIKGDDYYIERGLGTFDQIAFYTNECIESLYGYNINNPILDDFGGKAYFGYDLRTFDRDGLLIAQIKSAAHLITQEDKKIKKRFLDSSRSNNLSILKETLFFPDYRIKIINPRGELTYNYIYEKDKKFYIAITLIEENCLGRVITFLPNNSKGSVRKKITSAIETEVKSSTAQKPSF